MRIWTVQPPPAGSQAGNGRRSEPRLPVLIPEAFSWAALLFGPLWLLAHRLWLEAALVLGVTLLAGLLLPAALAVPALVAAQLLLGLHAQDLRRAALARRGQAVAHVVAELNADRALARLLDARPDLIGRAESGPAGPGMNLAR